MQMVNIVAGVILLLFGRKLFWLFLGIAGFLFGMEIAPVIFAGQPQWLQPLIAIGLGCGGAILAIVAQRLAFAFGGFFAGMYLALMAVQPFITDGNGAILLIAVGAGIIGALIATLVMDKAITLLACLVGAGAIVGEVHFGPAVDLLVFLVLVGAGFVFQEGFRSAVRKE